MLLRASASSRLAVVSFCLSGLLAACAAADGAGTDEPATGGSGGSGTTKGGAAGKAGGTSKAGTGGSGGGEAGTGGKGGSAGKAGSSAKGGSSGKGGASGEGGEGGESGEGGSASGGAAGSGGSAGKSGGAGKGGSAGKAGAGGSAGKAGGAGKSGGGGANAAGADAGGSDAGGSDAGGQAGSGDAGAGQGGSGDAGQGGSGDAGAAGQGGTGAGGAPGGLATFWLNELYLDMCIDGDRYEWAEIGGPAGASTKTLALRIFEYDASKTPEIKLTYTVPLGDNAVLANGLTSVGGQLSDAKIGIGLANWGLPEKGYVQLVDTVSKELYDAVGYGDVPAAESPTPGGYPTTLLYGAAATRTAFDKPTCRARTVGRRPGTGRTDNKSEFCIQIETINQPNLDSCE